MKDIRNIEFLYEIGQLRLINRMWRRFFQSDVANVAEHTFRVIWIALIIAKEEKCQDTEKILKMAIAHDLAESRTGDVDYVSRQYVEMKDEMANEDIFKDTSLEEEFLELLEEYEKRETLAAKIVKDADNLDCDFELKEQFNQPVSAKFKEARKTFVQPILFTKTAKKYWSMIYKNEISDWHFNGRNRFNRGDWKKSIGKINKK